MSELKVNMMMSLDGYVAAAGQSEENPFGIGGMQLTEWLFPLKAFREMHGEEGGEVNASTPIDESWLTTSARPSWAATCSAAVPAPGETIHGWGGGSRLFDNIGSARPKLEQVQVVEAPGVTHIRYRVTSASRNT